MKKHNIQASFFDEVMLNNNIQDNRKSIYAKLIYMRFEEVITSSLPQSCEIIGKRNEEYIKEFIVYGSHSEEMKDISFEFVAFLYDTNKINSKLLKETLEFELNELKLYLSSNDVKSVGFDFKRNYKLAKSCMLMKVGYEIINQTYNKQKQYILIYKDIDTYDVYHMELTKTLYELLNALRYNISLDATLKLVCKKENLEYNKVKPIIIDTIKTFCKKGIMR